MTEQISEVGQKVINAFKSLSLGGKTVTAPYFINDKRRKDLRAMVGKGTPDEIVMEARIWEKLKGVDFSTMTEKEIKQFLMNIGLGIDCSGFVLYVLDALYQEKTGKHIFNRLTPLKNSFLWPLMYRLRPVENMGAETLTNDENSVRIAINDVHPGDLFRSKAKKNNGHHIMIITKVERDESNNVTKITYTHSSQYYADENGVKTGDIEITDPNKALEEQNWLEKDINGVNHTFEGYMVNPADNGLRRLKVFN